MNPLAEKKIGQQFKQNRNNIKWMQNQTKISDIYYL